MKINSRLPRIFSEQASLEIIRNMFRDILTYYALLGLILAACQFFIRPTAIPDWLFLIGAAGCWLITLLWIAAISASNISQLDGMFESRRDKVWVFVLMLFTFMMLILSVWAAVKIAYR